MQSMARGKTWVFVGLAAVVLWSGCSDSPDRNGKLDDQQVLADVAAPQTVRVGKRVVVEVDIPPNVLPSRQPLTVNVRTDVVRKGAIPVGKSVEFQPAGMVFTAVVKVRQPLPAPSPKRRYAAFQSFPDSDVWVRRAPGRKLPKVDQSLTTEVWELEADTSGFWSFVEEDESEVLPPPPDAAAPADAEPMPVPPAPASLTVSSAAVAFGNVVFGTQALATTITVMNVGELNTGALTVSVSGDAAGGFALLKPFTCDGADLVAGGACTVRVFAEPSQAVAAKGVLSIASASGAMASVSLSVVGIKPPRLVADLVAQTFKPAPVDALGEALPLTFTNEGDLETGVIAFAFQGADAASFSIDKGNCTTPLAKGQSCAVKVTVTPAKLGALAATLKATAGPGGTAVVDLTGTGLGLDQGAKLVFTSPTAANNQVYFNEFAIGACSAPPLDFTVANQGAYASEPLVVAFTGAQAGDYLIVAGNDTCTGKRLPIGGTCVVRINVCSAVWGDHRSTLTVSAKATQAATVDLYGYSS